MAKKSRMDLLSTVDNFLGDTEGLLEVQESQRRCAEAVDRLLQSAAPCYGLPCYEDADAWFKYTSLVHLTDEELDTITPWVDPRDHPHCGPDCDIVKDGRWVTREKFDGLRYLVYHLFVITENFVLADEYYYDQVRMYNYWAIEDYYDRYQEEKEQL